MDTLRVVGVASGLVLFAAAAYGCGDDDGGGGDVAEYCSTFCDKAVECGFAALLGGRDGCMSNCQGDRDDGDDGCAPPDPDACISAVGNLSCDDLMSGDAPAACECEGESGNGGDGDNQDVSLGSNAGAGPGGDVGGCDELRSCCAALPQMGQAGCITTADTNNDQACGFALSTFISTGLCQ